MQINNPLQMNDWAIKKFLTVVLAIQLAMWGVIGLDAIGLQIPILRQLIGFIYLTFIPGIIILRVLKLHKLSNIETLLYTVGLSIGTLMFTGLFMNMVYPLFGISGPISLLPLIITISVIVLVLCILSYVRDKDFSDPSFIDVGGILSPPVLFLCLVPFLAILGTYFVNFYHNNILLMLMIVVIALIVLLIAFDKFIPKNLYPLAVFVIAISLLYHNSLISMYLWGWDIYYELYLTNLVKMNSIWDSTMYGSCNAMLSLVMLAPIYSIISDMSITWVFKIIYPLLFSIVPLGLYHVFQKQTNDKIAFLSCFFFVSLFTFYSQMLSLARQEIAELFLVLLILLMIDKNIDKIKRSFLLIVFGFSLAVSHYGLSYIYMFCLIFAWLLLVLAENPEMQRWRNNLHAKFGRYKRDRPVGNPNFLKIKDRTISSTFVVLFIIFTLTWYMYVSSSTAFNTIVHIGDHIASSIFTDFLNPETAEGLDIILKEISSPLHKVTKYLHLLSQFFIFVGVIALMLKREVMKFEREYEAFTLINSVICFAGIAVPFFASSLKTTRLYQITLIFLVPFCVIGGITVFRGMAKMVRVSWTDKRVRHSLNVLSVFFVLLLLFNSGFVYEIADDRPRSISLSSDAIPYFYTHEQDMVGAEWLAKLDDSAIVYGDYFEWLMLPAYGFFTEKQCKKLHERTEHTLIRRENAYMYVRYGDVVTYEKGGCERYTIYSPKFFQCMNKIYDNDCVIYR